MSGNIDVHGLLGAAIMCLSSLSLVEAQAPQAMTASIGKGDCNTSSQENLSLNPLSIPDGLVIGATEGVTAATSFTELELPITDLLDETRVIAVRDGSSRLVACGRIGGIRDENGTLILALPTRGTSGVQGIAYIAPTDDFAVTAVSIFVDPGSVKVQSRAQIDARPTAIPRPASTATPRPTATLSSSGLLSVGEFAETEDWLVHLVSLDLVQDRVVGTLFIVNKSIVDVSFPLDMVSLAFGQGEATSPYAGLVGPDGQFYLGFDSDLVNPVLSSGAGTHIQVVFATSGNGIPPEVLHVLVNSD